MTVKTNNAIAFAALRHHLAKSQADIFQGVPSHFTKRYGNYFFMCSVGYLSLHSNLPKE